MDARLVSYLATLGFGPESLDGWTVTVAERDGRECGFTVVSGPEIHMLAFEAGAMSRKNILAHLAPILEQYGYATTRVPLAETEHKLRDMLGFKNTWSDDRFHYFALTELPFQKRKPSCL